MKRFLIALACLLPVGCLPQPETDAEKACGAAELAYLVGQSGSVLDAMRFAGPVRILDWNQPMTMDFNPERLNIRKDEAGVIDRVWCG